MTLSKPLNKEKALEIAAKSKAEAVRADEHRANLKFAINKHGIQVKE